MRWRGSGGSVSVKQIMEGLVRYGKGFGFYSKFDGNHWHILSGGVTPELWLRGSI